MTSSVTLEHSTNRLICNSLKEKFPEFLISLEAFLLTEFRTSGYSSERFVRASLGMPVLFSLLIAGNSYENISRVGFINNFGSETASLRENYLYPDNGQDYR